MQLFLKSHYRHHTARATTDMGINTDILPAYHTLYYNVELNNIGNLPAALRHV